MLTAYSLLALSLCLLFAGPIHAHYALRAAFSERRYRLFLGRAGRLRGLELPTPRERWVFRLHVTIAVLISISGCTLFWGLVDPPSARVMFLRALLLFGTGGLGWIYLETALTRTDLLGGTHWLSPWIQVGPADDLDVPTNHERRLFRRHLLIACFIGISGVLASMFVG